MESRSSSFAGSSGFGDLFLLEVEERRAAFRHVVVMVGTPLSVTWRQLQAVAMLWMGEAVAPDVGHCDVALHRGPKAMSKNAAMIAAIASAPSMLSQ